MQKLLRALVYKGQAKIVVDYELENAKYIADDNSIHIRGDLNNELTFSLIAKEMANAYLAANHKDLCPAHMTICSYCADYILCKRYSVPIAFKPTQTLDSLKSHTPNEVRALLNKARQAAAAINQNMERNLNHQHKRQHTEAER